MVVPPLHAPEPAPSERQPVDSLAIARISARLASCTEVDELRDLVGDSLRTLLGPVRRFELFSADAQGGLMPTARLGSGEFGAGLKLLSALLPAGHPPTEVRFAARNFRRPRLVAPMRGVNRGSLIAVPLIERDRLRALVVAESLLEAPFAPVDLEVIEGFAGLFLLVLGQIAAREDEASRGRVQRDLQLAERIQRALLPEPLPPRCGLVADVRYQPAHVIGGDFYDLAVHGDGSATAIVGDVCGKGISGALVMAHLVPEVRRLVRSGMTPAHLLGALNRVVSDSVGAEGLFVTATCVRIEAGGGRMTAATAGGVPLILRRGSGAVETFGLGTGAPLGMLDAEQYLDETVRTAAGDTIVLMSDGLIEALDRPSDRLGMSLLGGLIEYAPPEPHKLNDRILTAVAKMKGARHMDDVTMLTLHVL